MTEQESAVLLTQEELEERGAYWQHRLRLMDWDVRFLVSRSRDFCLEGVQGECDWQLKTKTAVIRVIDPLDYPPGLLWPQDMEQTLVHELLHLHFAPFAAEDGTPQATAQEQAIDLTAMALVAENRRQQEAPTS